MNLQPISSTPTTIITGFLGAGKTTLINQLIGHKARTGRWALLIRACPYLDNEAKNRLNRQQNKANCADNIGILSNNLMQFCQI